MATSAASLQACVTLGPGAPSEDNQPAFSAALAQLGRSFEQVALGDGNAHVMLTPMHEQQLVAQRQPGAEPGNTVSSSEATTAYSSSESSSAGDNQVDSSLLESYLPAAQGGALAVHRPSDGTLRPFGVVQGGEGKAQICFDFTKGVCTRGDKCKYSHDLATIVHFNSKEKGICFDYLRNQCHRGLLCRFSHDLSNIAQQCQVYNNTKENKNGKPNAICYDFVKGVCTRGAECRYSHDLSLIARMARGGQTPQKAMEVCYDYLRGRCNRGATCKYSHNISFLAAPGFLGSAMEPNGAPMAASASGGMPGNGAMSGVLPAPMQPGNGIAQMPGMAQRLSNAISADHATLNALAAVAAASQGGPMGPMALASASSLPNGTAMPGPQQESERRRRSASVTGEAGDACGAAEQGQPGPWPNMAPMAKAAMANAALAQQAAAYAVHQRMAQAAAAGYGQMQGIPMVAHGTASNEAMGQTGGMHMTASMFNQMPRPGPMPFVHGDAGPMHGMPSMGRPHGLPPLPPNANFTPESIAALLSSMPDNGGMQAEALHMLAAAAAAKAQAHQQAQAQTARMMAAAASQGIMPPGHMVQGAANMSGAQVPQQSMPQPIPGREAPASFEGNGSNFNGGASFNGTANGPCMPQQGAAHGMEQLSRSAPAGPGGAINPAALNPDLLPMIKEIWATKPGVH